MFLLQANATSLLNVADLRLIAPELILTACACVALVMEVILPYRKSKLTAYFALVGVALALISLYFQMGTQGDGFYGMVRIDGWALLCFGYRAVSRSICSRSCVTLSPSFCRIGTTMPSS